MRTLRLVLVLFLVACGGSGSNDDNGNNGAPANSGHVAAEDECDSDDDCPAASAATFADPDQVTCKPSALGAYCTECETDGQCGRGYACREATYCEQLPACDRGTDCAADGAKVHKACIARYCDFCVDNSDCGDGEVCYSRLCVAEESIDAACLSVEGSAPSCTGRCEVQTTDEVATGISCVE